MRNDEDLTLITEVSKSVIEYIGKVLLDRSKPVTIIEFKTTEIDEQNVCVFELHVLQSGFNRSFNLEIPASYDCEFYNTLLNDILNIGLESDRLEISKFYQDVKEEQISEGIDIVLDYKNKVKLKFTNLSNKSLFKKITDDYNDSLDNYHNQKEIKKIEKIRKKELTYE